LLRCDYLPNKSKNLSSSNFESKLNVKAHKSPPVSTTNAAQHSAFEVSQLLKHKKNKFQFNRMQINQTFLKNE